MNEDLPRECPRLLFSMIKSSRQAVVDIVGAWMKAVADILIMDCPEEKKRRTTRSKGAGNCRVAVARGVDGGASFGKQPASHTLKARYSPSAESHGCLHLFVEQSCSLHSSDLVLLLSLPKQNVLLVGEDRPVASLSKVSYLQRPIRPNRAANTPTETEPLIFRARSIPFSGAVDRTT